jgi:hypothetical protein
MSKYGGSSQSSGGANDLENPAIGWPLSAIRCDVLNYAGCAFKG